MDVIWLLHIRRVRPETLDFCSDSRREIQDPSQGSDLRPETSDPETGFSENFISFLQSLAIINEFLCFMRLCLFCMFLITLSYGMNIFGLL